MNDTPRKPEKITEDALSIEEHYDEAAVNSLEDRQALYAEPQREPGKVEAEAAQAMEDDSSKNAFENEKIYSIKKRKEITAKKHISYFFIFSSLLLWTAYELVQWVFFKWDESFIAGFSTTVLITSLFSVLAYVIYNDIKSIRIIKDLDINLCRSDDGQCDSDWVEKYINRVAETIKIEKPDTYSDFIKASHARTETAELISLFKNTVLIDIDKEAERKIEQYARSSSVALAVLPHPALDAIVIVIQAVRMTKDIGALYGIHTGFFTSLYLMRETVKNIMLLTSIDFMGEVLVDEFSAGVAGKAGKGIAKGAVIYYRVKRLGNATKKLCRPDF